MLERRKDVLDEILEKLDETCSLILTGIIMNPKGIGFNELHRQLRKKNKYRAVAKTTLSQHLLHLQASKLIDKDKIQNSPLTIKPSNYHTSQYFKELSKGFIAQSTTVEYLLPEILSKDIKSLTNDLIRVILLHLSESLKSVLQVPENIFVWNMHQAFYNIETLVRAYKKRVIKNKEEGPALKAIEEWITKVKLSIIES